MTNVWSVAGTDTPLDSERDRDARLAEVAQKQDADWAVLLDDETTAPESAWVYRLLGLKPPVTLTLRSLTDFDAMAEGGTQLAGLGESAMQTQSGVSLKISGQPHFFHVVVTGPHGLEVEKTIELAKVVAASVK